MSSVNEKPTAARQRLRMAHKEANPSRLQAKGGTLLDTVVRCVRNQASVSCFVLNNGSTVHMCFPKQVVFVRNAASFSLVPASTFNVSNDTSTQVGTRSSVQLANTLVFIALHTAQDDMAYPTGHCGKCSGAQVEFGAKTCAISG